MVRSRGVGLSREDDVLSPDERDFLGAVAREAVRSRLEGEPFALELPEKGPLTEPGSAFVTLRNEGRLRGCIGLIGHSGPLVRIVREAGERALSDPRFSAIESAELPDLTIEVSILSPFHEVSKAEEVEVGRHGLYLSRGGRGGLLLPQVAMEQGWDRDTFLTHCCLKAGLPGDDWKKPGIRIEVFTAEVF
jgi:AmmeMemoRadiSam system protein A